MIQETIDILPYHLCLSSFFLFVLNSYITLAFVTYEDIRNIPCFKSMTYKMSALFTHPITLTLSPFLSIFYRDNNSSHSSTNRHYDQCRYAHNCKWETEKDVFTCHTYMHTQHPDGLYCLQIRSVSGPVSVLVIGGNEEKGDKKRRTNNKRRHSSQSEGGEGDRGREDGSPVKTPRLLQPETVSDTERQEQHTDDEREEGEERGMDAQLASKIINELIESHSK